MTETNEIICRNIRSVVIGSEYQRSSEWPGSTAFDPTLILPVRGVESRPSRPSRTVPPPHPPLGWLAWLPRGAARSFFSSVSFCAFCLCCAPVCAYAEVGEWTRGGVCGALRVCGLERETQKKKRKEIVVRAGPIMFFSGFASKPPSTLSLLEWHGSPQIRSSVYPGD